MLRFNIIFVIMTFFMRCAVTVYEGTMLFKRCEPSVRVNSDGSRKAVETGMQR